LPRAAEVVRFVESRRRDDGGYVEVAAMRRSGTNPTAAAVGLLQLVADEGDALTPAERDRVGAFPGQMNSPDGGLRAKRRGPLADLLSTFTATWTLEQLGQLYRIDRDQVREFARSLEQQDGGFFGGLWDEASDVEYTFYGLGVLALLS